MSQRANMSHGNLWGFNTGITDRHPPRTVHCTSAMYSRPLGDLKILTCPCITQIANTSIISSVLPITPSGHWTSCLASAYKDSRVSLACLDGRTMLPWPHSWSPECWRSPPPHYLSPICPLLPPSSSFPFEKSFSYLQLPLISPVFPPNMIQDK